MQKTSFKGVLMLLVAAMIWGSTFIAQSVGMDSVQPFTFNGIRTMIGSLVLIPVILLRSKAQPKVLHEQKKSASKKIWLQGIIIGVLLCIASNLQQIALSYPEASAGKIAFITATYMFMVPLLGLFVRKRISKVVWLCIVLGLLGLFFLCINPAELTAINTPDVLTIICAFFFALHILAVEKFSQESDGVKLSCLQFLVSGTISIIFMFLFEQPKIAAIQNAAIPILYAGVLSCGVAYTFQVVGQKYTEATVASLLMCSESLFAVVFEALLLSTGMQGREIIGCTIMMVAIVLSQLSDKFNKKIPTE